MEQNNQSLEVLNDPNTFRMMQEYTYMVTISNIENEPVLEEIMHKVQKKEKNIKYVIIAKEQHESLNYHIHILIKYTNRRKILNPKIYNYIYDKQANISKARNEKEAIEYVIKDGSFIAYNIDLEAYLANIDQKPKERESPEAFISSLIIRGATIEQVMLECEAKGMPYLIELTKKHKTYKSMIHFNFERNASKDRPKQKRLTLEHIDVATKILKNNHQFELEYATILDALKHAILVGPNREHKTKNLHLFSRLANAGKTTLLMFLNQHLECYYYPPIQWFSEYYNGKYNCIIWDEFTMPKDIYHFNLFFEGAPVDLQVKYSNNITKSDNPLIICCSNYPLRYQIEKYTKAECEYCRKLPLEETHTYQHCSYSQQAISLRSTVSARVVEVELHHVLFPMINALKQAISTI